MPMMMIINMPMMANDDHQYANDDHHNANDDHHPRSARRLQNKGKGVVIKYCTVFISAYDHRSIMIVQFCNNNYTEAYHIFFSTMMQLSRKLVVS